MILYISGPYSGDTENNIEKARKEAIRLWNAGHTVICPHMNTAFLEEACQVTHAEFVERDLLLIARCDGIVLLKDWEESKGACIELQYARDVLQLPVWVSPDIPPLHPTELKCPMQSKAFIEELMKLYRLHLSKNQDYSPSNILVTGEIGLTTRLWDKVARLMNLIGFRFTAQSGGYTAPLVPKNESIEDTYHDLAVYSIIGLLLRRNVWGK